jgi:predicted signal transduction protein with EAL and GGDEF domain
LKIDREFVRDLPSDAEDAAIIVAIIALGRTLNLEIVAEGVETAEQQEFLTRLGCDSLQGFLLGRPLPAEQFILATSQSAHRFPTQSPGDARSDDCLTWRRRQDRREWPPSPAAACSLANRQRQNRTSLLWPGFMYPHNSTT